MMVQKDSIKIEEDDDLK